MRFIARLLDVAEFQFHNGSIKSFGGGISKDAADGFQFHNGSIKSEGYHLVTLIKPVFQFHNGSIKRIPDGVLFFSMISVSIPQWFD